MNGWDRLRLEGEFGVFLVRSSYGKPLLHQLIEAARGRSYMLL